MITCLCFLRKQKNKKSVPWGSIFSLFFLLGRFLSLNNLVSLVDLTDTCLLMTPKAESLAQLC